MSPSAYPEAWAKNPPKPGDPHYGAYVRATPHETARLAALAERTVGPGPLVEALRTPAAADAPEFQVDERSVEEQVAAFGAPLAPCPTVVPPALPGGDLADYLDKLRSFLCRYVAFPSEHEPVAIALWVAHAWHVEQLETSPILAVTSAEMRSGKTRVLDCLELLVPDPFRVVTPSEAVVYTVLAQRPRPTMLLDEAGRLVRRDGA